VPQKVIVLKIYCIAPVIESVTITLAGYQSCLDREIANYPDVKLVGRLLERGPSAVENEIDDALSVPDILRIGLEAEQDGAHGVLIDCMLDPGLKALRCAVDIPVVGTAAISFHLAATLGNKFGIVDVCDDTGPMVGAQVRALGLGDKFAGVRGTGLAVEEVASDTALTSRKLLEAAMLAVEKDGADVIVLGCTLFSRMAGALRQSLLDQKLDVPVIAPTTLTIGTLIAIVRSGLAHSKWAFPTPQRKKNLRGYAFPQLYSDSKD
jgi:allantoin racemase